MWNKKTWDGSIWGREMGRKQNRNHKIWGQKMRDIHMNGQVMQKKNICIKKDRRQDGCFSRVNCAEFLAFMTVLALLPAGCSGREEGVQQPSIGEPVQKTDALENAQSSFTPTGDTALASEKEETVQVKAAADGSAQEVTVETTLRLPEGSGDIEDFTRLTDIKNTEGDEEFVLREDGTLIFENHGADITYEGTGSEPLPVDVKISYYLDGEEISPEELAGKSGAVRIRFDYTNRTVHEDTKVPFLALSFAMLSGDHFSHVEAENGEVMDFGGNVVVFGMALPGLDECLSLKELEAAKDVELPQYVEISADAEDFELDFTETIITSGLFAELDDEDLDDLSDMKKKTRKLDKGMTKLAEGADSLTDGLQEMKKHIRNYTDGVSALDSGIGELSKQMNALNQNKQSMTEGIAALSARIEEMKPLLSAEDYASLTQLLAGMQGYVDAVDALSGAAGQLKSGSHQLAASGNSFGEGMDALIDGSGKLGDGLEKLGDNGIDKLVKLLGSDLQKIVKELRALKAADTDYTSFAGSRDGQTCRVRFFVETEGV